MSEPNAITAVARRRRWLDNFAENALTFFDIPDATAGRIETPLPAIVSAAGWSIHDAAPIVADWPGAVFSGLSEAVWWETHARPPDYLVALDGLSEQAKKLPLEHGHSTLIAHPCVHPDVLSCWGGELRRYFALHTDGMLAWVHDLYEDSPQRVTILGGSVNCNIALTLAVRLGYNPIYLVGCDMSTVDGHGRWDDTENYDPDHYRGFRLEVHHLDAEGKEISSNTAETGFEMLLARNDLLGAVKDPHNPVSQATVVSCSRGILNFLPYCTPEQALREARSIMGKAGYEAYGKHVWTESGWDTFAETKQRGDGEGS